MRSWLKIFSLLLLPVLSGAQRSLPDSLYEVFQKSSDDSLLYKAANHLYDYYEEVSRDSAFYYADQCVILSRRNNKKLNEAYSLTRKAYQELNIGRFADALHSLLEGFSISQEKENDGSYWETDPIRLEQSKRLYALSCTHHIFGLLMWRTLNREQELVHFKEARRIAVEINSPARSLLGSLNLGRIYFEAGRFDSAMAYQNEAEEIANSSGRKKYLTSIFHFQGMIKLNKKDTAAALHYFYESIRFGLEQNNLDGLVRSYHQLADFYIGRNKLDSSLFYAGKELEIFKKLGSVSVVDYHIGIAYADLNRIYQARNQPDSAYKYLALAQRTNDSINQHRIKSLAEFQKLTLSEQQRLQTAEKEKVEYRNSIRTWLLLSIIFYRNNLHKQKAKIKIEQAYDNLKAAQLQLIQSEKMASLGELTAGIAHEIQNPLNFVNNFSEVNIELIDEATGEIDKGNIPELKLLLNDIKDNEQKINHHGKRADAIVKGMLQHSRGSSGVKESTDINVLVDEYLRLASHGFRAKDNSFNAAIDTDYDKSAGSISVVPQDFGKVVLNLINNAFYAVTERKKQSGAEYEPTVWVSTKRSNDRIEIRVRITALEFPGK